MTFYALLTAGLFLTLWGIVVSNTGGGVSFFIVKLLPAIIGIWCLWEAAIIFIS